MSKEELFSNVGSIAHFRGEGIGDMLVTEEKVMGEKLMRQHLKAAMKFFELLVTTVNHEIEHNMIDLPMAELRDIQRLWNARFASRDSRKNSLKKVLTMRSR